MFPYLMPHVYSAGWWSSLKRRKLQANLCKIPPFRFFLAITQKWAIEDMVDLLR